MKKILQIAFVLGLAFTSSVGVAQDFEAGVRAAETGDYENALKEWRPLAEQGYAAAQYNLGLLYNGGEGVPQDYTEAVRWYRMAAEQGNADAQFNLAAMNDNGRGVKKINARRLGGTCRLPKKAMRLRNS